MSKAQVNGIVLAAGLGTRLRPITGAVPKPMVPVCNRPLLGTILTNLQSGGVGQIAVNTHYLADSVHEYIGSSEFSSTVSLFHEEEILGTGGPLVNAKEVLTSTEHFVLHNGDILSDIDIEALVQAHISSGNAVTMVMIDGPENKVRVDDSNTVVDIIGKMGVSEDVGRLFTYAGISVYSQKIFNYLPGQPQNYSIITAILDAMRDDAAQVGAYIPDSPYWNDLGTIKQYFKAHQDILKDEVVQLAQWDLAKCKPTGSAAEQCSGFVSIASDSNVPESAHLTDCIVLEGATIEEHTRYRKEILGPGFCVHADIEAIRKVSFYDTLRECRFTSLVEQGSDRQFYRLSKEGHSQVLMLSNERDQDFERFLVTGSILEDAGVPVPRIYNCDRDTFAVLMDDMGSKTLFDAVQDSTEQEILALYQQAIRKSAALHSRVKWSEDIAHSIRKFDYDYLRWETTYFSDNFLANYCGLSQDKLEDLELFFDVLATQVLADPQVVMHRDFQSQNIVISNDNTIGFVDFQGARLGSLGYDAMSLINDPYVELSDEMRTQLLNFYYEALTGCGFDLSADLFYKITVSAGLQRAMQALGAYAFLALKKGKKHYLAFVPRCFDYLLQGVKNYKSLNAGSSIDVLSDILDEIKLPDNAF